MRMSWSGRLCASSWLRNRIWRDTVCTASSKRCTSASTSSGARVRVGMKSRPVWNRTSGAMAMPLAAATPLNFTAIGSGTPVFPARAKGMQQTDLREPGTPAAGRSGGHRSGAEESRTIMSRDQKRVRESDLLAESALFRSVDDPDSAPDDHEAGAELAWEDDSDAAEEESWDDALVDDEAEPEPIDEVVTRRTRPGRETGPR